MIFEGILHYLCPLVEWKGATTATNSVGKSAVLVVTEDIYLISRVCSICMQLYGGLPLIPRTHGVFVFSRSLFIYKNVWLNPGF